VSVTDRLGRGVSVLSSGGGTRDGTAVTWRAGSLGAGATQTFALTTRFTSSARLGPYVNRVTADAGNSDPATSQAVTVVAR
jgi:hypothetical protein